MFHTVKSGPRFIDYIYRLCIYFYSLCLCFSVTIGKTAAILGGQWSCGTESYGGNIWISCSNWDPLLLLALFYIHNKRGWAHQSMCPVVFFLVLSTFVIFFPVSSSRNLWERVYIIRILEWHTGDFKISFIEKFSIS